MQFEKSKNKICKKIFSNYYWINLFLPRPAALVGLGNEPIQQAARVTGQGCNIELRPSFWPASRPAATPPLPAPIDHGWDGCGANQKADWHLQSMPFPRIDILLIVLNNPLFVSSLLTSEVNRHWQTALRTDVVFYHWNILISNGI